MCRVLYSLHPSKNHIVQFLKQSDHLEKHTPGIDSASDHNTHPDGFGLASSNLGRSLNLGRWSVFKSPKLYKRVANLSPAIDQISQGDVVIGHIRRVDSRYTRVSRENTHPFYYRNRVFVHNGYLKDFDKHRSAIVRHIDPDLRSHIKGDTDSEVMFYLYLSILRKKESIMRDVVKLASSHCYPDNDPTPTILRESMVDLFALLQEIVPAYMANIIYADKEYSVITRKSVGGLDAPSLYMNRTKRGVLISSEPITRSYDIVPENTCIIIHHESGAFM